MKTLLSFITPVCCGTPAGENNAVALVKEAQRLLANLPNTKVTINRAWAQNNRQMYKIFLVFEWENEEDMKQAFETENMRQWYRCVLSGWRIPKRGAAAGFEHLLDAVVQSCGILPEITTAFDCQGEQIAEHIANFSIGDRMFCNSQLFLPAPDIKVDGRNLTGVA